MSDILARLICSKNSLNSDYSFLACQFGPPFAIEIFEWSFLLSFTMAYLPSRSRLATLALGSLSSLIFFFTHCILYIFEFNIVRWRGYGSD